jgi:hypothetical protein
MIVVPAQWGMLFRAMSSRGDSLSMSKGLVEVKGLGGERLKEPCRWHQEFSPEPIRVDFNFICA